MCSWTYVYEHVFMKMYIWTCVHEHMYMNMCSWTCVREHVYMNMCTCMPNKPSSGARAHERNASACADLKRRWWCGLGPCELSATATWCQVRLVADLFCVCSCVLVCADLGYAGKTFGDVFMCEMRNVSIFACLGCKSLDFLTKHVIMYM